MKNMIFKFTLLVLAISLSACSGRSGFPGFMSGGQGEQASASQNGGLVGTSVDRQGNERNVNITMTGGGEIGLKSMDADDKLKMSRALDAGTGKATHWENGATGVSYTVTPIRKVVVQGNPFCREYAVEAKRGSVVKNGGGTACVTTDGSWHTI